MTKKTILILAACIATALMADAQTMYRKNYSGTTQLSVEGPIAENGKRRTYYRITDKGKAYYDEKCDEWKLTKEVVEKFISQNEEAANGNN